MPIVVNHREQEIASWRPGNRTRLKMGGSAGSERIAIAEQWFEPGTGAPMHTHGDIEETITVLAGSAEFWVDDERVPVDEEMTIVLPPFSHHAFSNVGDGILHVLGVWSAASVPTEYVEEPEQTYAIGGTEGTRVDATRTAKA